VFHSPSVKQPVKPGGDLPARFLQLLSRGGIRSTSELARQLGVSDGLVTLMAEDLTRRGYLVALSGGERSECGAGCAGCELTPACAAPGAQDRPPLLALTPRGRQLVATTNPAD
jgi:hypothetical protein